MKIRKLKNFNLIDLNSTKLIFLKKKRKLVISILYLDAKDV